MFLEFLKNPKKQPFFNLGSIFGNFAKTRTAGPPVTRFCSNLTEIFLGPIFAFFGISKNCIKKEKFWCRLEQNRVIGGPAARVFAKTPKMDPKLKNGHFWRFFENSKNMHFLPLCDILTFTRARKIRGGKIDESIHCLVGPFVLFSYPEKIRGLSRKTREEIDFEKKNLQKF